MHFILTSGTPRAVIFILYLLPIVIGVLTALCKTSVKTWMRFSFIRKWRNLCSFGYRRLDHLFGGRSILVKQRKAAFVGTLRNIYSSCYVLINLLVYILWELGLVDLLASRSLNWVLTWGWLTYRTPPSVLAKLYFVRGAWDWEICFLFWSKPWTRIQYALTLLSIIGLCLGFFDITPGVGCTWYSSWLFLEALWLIHY